MNKEKLLAERTKNFIKATNRDKPEYVPVLANPAPGVVSYAKTTLKDVIDDEEKCLDALLKIFDDLYCDATISHGFAYLPHAKDTFGYAQNILGPDGVTIEHLQQSFMKEDEYSLLIKDSNAFVSDVLVKRKYPFLFADDIEKVKEMMKSALYDFWYAYVNIPDKLIERLEKNYGVPTITNGWLMVFNPLDILFDSLRGFTGTTTDLRRHKSEVKESLEILWQTRCNHFEEVDCTYPYGAQWPHIPAYMNIKQFEELYWPYEKKMIENLYKNGNKLFMLAEGKWMHLLDYFRDVPKDSVIIHCDDDDVIEVSKKIGDWQIIAGGANLHRTRMASKEDNIEYTKKVIDECAGRGAFIFTTDKNWTCPGDVNQNLIDIYRFAHEYGKY